MKLANKQSKGNKLSFEISDGDGWYVNTLRRLVMNETPIMAIESVEITKNDSILYDEIIAHRLGLLPLQTDLGGYVLATSEEMEKQDFLAQSSCKLTLKAKGPGIVYAKDLKSKDPKVVPVYPETPIVKLHDDQELEMEATAVLGKGKEHVKWSAGHAYFTSDNDTFTFKMESWGQLTPEEAIDAGIQEFTKQLKEFDSLIKEL